MRNRLAFLVLAIAWSLFRTDPVQSDELMFAFGGAKDLLGGRYPTTSLIRFDTDQGQSTDYGSVVSDLFFVSSLAITDNHVAFIPGSNGVVEAVDILAGSAGERLGSLTTQMRGLITDIEYAAGHVLVTSPTGTVLFDSEGSQVVPTDTQWDVTEADMDSAGDMLLWDGSSRSIFKLTPTGSVATVAAELGNMIADFKVGNDDSIYLAATSLLYDNMTIPPATVGRFSADGVLETTIFSALDHFGCDDCGRDDVSISSLEVASDGSLFVAYNDTTSGRSVGHLVNIDADGAVLGEWTFPEGSLLAVSRVPTLANNFPRGGFPIGQPSGPAADVNGDGVMDVRDLDRLSEAVRRADSDLTTFDLNSDGIVSQADRTYFVRVAANSFFGDSNMDGRFDSSDFVQVFQAGEYDDDLAGNSTWSTGDWDGDGEFLPNDLILAFQSGGYFAGIENFRLPSAQSVPEPASGLLCVVGILICTRWCATRRVRGRK
jgi:hypothetical protein